MGKSKQKENIYPNYTSILKLVLDGEKESWNNMYEERELEHV
jgi:hypothetical protein